MFNEVSKSELEHVFSVVLPHSSEVGLVRDISLLFMGIDHILLGDHLRDKLASSFPFLLELFSAFWCSGVHTKNEFVILIGMSE